MPKKRLNLLLRRHVWQPLFSIALVASLVVTPSLHAQLGVSSSQTPLAADRTELHQALLDLNNPWTVMCIAAHPDDEDGATLTVLRRKYGVHTVSLFSTFGEGGQNAIGPELYDELGVIRVRETMKASVIQGSEPHFLGLKDFGFSKSADEAFRVWGHDAALRKMVEQIRKLRPDVIITNHDTTSGHGHHQATGRLALEAFDAAADPERFPDQLKETAVWQVQRLFVRFRSDPVSQRDAKEGDAAQTEGIVTINPNEFDSIRKSTYAEQALRALQQHASQGPWPQEIRAGGMPPITYRLVREATEAESLPANSNTLWDGLRLNGRLTEFAKPLTIDGRPPTDFLEDPERVFKAILDDHWAKTVISGKQPNYQPTADDYHFGRRLEQERNFALAAAKGIAITISPQTKSVTPNTTVTFTLTVTNHGITPFTLYSVEFLGLGLRGGLIRPDDRLAPQESKSYTQEAHVFPGAELYIPRTDSLYSDRIFGMPFTAAVLIDVAGQKVFAPVPVSHLNIMPLVEMGDVFTFPLVLTSRSLEQNQSLKLHLKNNLNQRFVGRLVIEPIGRKGRVTLPVQLSPSGSRDVAVEVKRIINLLPELPVLTKTPLTIQLSLYREKEDYPVDVRQFKVAYSDSRVAPNLKVGYIRSTDYTLRNALAALGVESQELNVADIQKSDLQRFDTIIVDNRGYQAHPELIDANPRLLEYAKNGGNLIVFYHKPNEWNPDAAKNRPNLAPYPVALGDERVTDENAPVAFTNPLHPLLNSPNKIGPDDFKNWIQERGLYYPKTWDAHYQTLFAMSDAGEDPLRSGLLVADYGKGHYIYTSLVWYRQLRAGVPGGYRMFANMISY